MYKARFGPRATGDQLFSSRSKMILCPCVVGVGESLEAKSHCRQKKVVV